MGSQTFLNFALVVLFVLIGGVSSATEMGLVSLRDSPVTAMARDGGRGARVAAVARNPNRFLAVVQIGVTVAGFLSAAYGGSTLAPDLAPYLVDAGMGEAAENTALVLLTLLIERLVGAQQQLLAGLAAGVERPRDLPPERAVVEQPAVLTRKGHSLRDGRGYTRSALSAYHHLTLLDGSGG